MIVVANKAFPDPSFEDAPRHRIGGAVVPLCDFQREAIASAARIKVYRWCRQAGKDFTASLEATLDALKKNQAWFIVSLTERQSLATFDKVKMHCRAWGVVLTDMNFVEDETTYWSRNEQKWCTVKSKTVVLPGGGSVTALPGADPDAIAGLTGNVIFTEFALFPNGGRDHWRVVFPLITRGFRIIAISTPRGSDTKHAELCRNARGKYFVSTVDIHRAVREGMKLVDEDGKTTTPAELEELYADPAGWVREYLVQESDELDALVSWKYLELAKADYEVIRLDVDSPEVYNPNYQNVFATLPRGKTYMLGWDIARTGHLSPIWVNSLEGDVYWLRLVLSMHKMDFDFMRKCVWQGMDCGMLGAGDATGLGMESCEQTAKRYPGMFAQVNFASSKGALGSTLMQTYQDVRQRIPAKGCDDIIHDIHAIQKEERNGKLILHETKNPVEKRSHCDIAYSNALSLHAGKEASDVGFDFL